MSEVDGEIKIRATDRSHRQVSARTRTAFPHVLVLRFRVLPRTLCVCGVRSAWGVTSPRGRRPHKAKGFLGDLFGEWPQSVVGYKQHTEIPPKYFLLTRAPRPCTELPRCLGNRLEQGTPNIDYPTQQYVKYAKSLPDQPAVPLPTALFLKLGRFMHVYISDTFRTGPSLSKEDI